MHKDLKFENVMLRRKVTRDSSLDDIHAIVIDVGLAELFGEQHSKCGRSNQRAGSPATMAPEIVKADFSYKCDIWSLGCMLFAIFNSSPFHIPDDKGGQALYMYPFFPEPSEKDPMGLEALYSSQRQGPPMAQVAAASPWAQEVICSMLHFDERLRPTAQECLGMPWFVQGPASEQRVGFSQELVDAILQEREHRFWWRATVLQAAACLPGSKIEPLERLFETMDHQKRGSLQRADFAAALQKLGVAHEAADRAAEAADFSGDGCIEWSEFVATCLPASRELFAVSLQLAFQNFDTNQDGILEPSEVLQLLRSEHIDGLHMPTSKTVETMVAELDKDSNGKISFREFHDYFVHVDAETFRV
mmetsp:Transcript_68459/g.189430  ORF Transcript_68459/g.189430 Transcript_68459/m.189430 type:complete len:361 (-) Transcript_68459:144-1226(-)